MNRTAMQIGLVMLLTAAGALAAEDYLTPPGTPGSDAARMRTLNEVLAAQPISRLPFSITNTGSYVVVGNLTGVSGSNGITILTDNVTLNLNGFSMNGVPGSQYGVNIPNPQTSIVILNGVLRNWGYYGIYAASTDNSTFSGLTSASNGWGAVCSGIYVGNNNLVTDCVVSGSKSFGIWAGNGCTIRDCKVYGNQGRGINATDGSTISGCSAYENGSDGIATYNGSTITRCMAYKNLNDGIYGQNCTIRDSATYNNTQNGIDAEMCTVSGVSSSANKGHGIYSLGSIISQCSLFRNEGDGIRANYTLVSGNSCVQNGYGTADGAGICAIGSQNRIDGNLVVANDRGIETTGAGNFIARNTATGNDANYAIIGTQTIGPVVTQTGTITEGNAWANFEF